MHVITGRTIWLFGLPAAGKTTISNKLFLSSIIPLVQLDGDVFRRQQHPILGFNPHDRSLNIRAAAMKAREINDTGQWVVAAFVTPYEELRAIVRDVLGSNVTLVHVDTPAELCEQRDPKGLYEAARAGMIEHFTGVSDRFDTPVDCDLVVDGSDSEAAAEKILRLWIAS